jgi:3,4-dihydroxybenzoate---[aryl-carrier protein] ligase
MLTINDVTLSRDYFDGRFLELRRLPHLKNPTGQRYAVCLPDAGRWLALCLYLKEAGASVAPLHPSTPLEAAKRLAKRMGCTQLLFHDETSSFSLERGAIDDAGVLVQLSSGTTGEPKSIERSWGAVDLEVESYVEALSVHAERVPLLACPVTHSYGLISGVLASLHRGVAPVVLTNINPKYVLRRASAEHDALLYASPTLLNVLVRLLPDGASLCPVMTSGAPMRAAWFHELRRRASGVLQQYGCSELGCISLNLDTHAAEEIGVPLRHLEVTAGLTKEVPEEIRARLDGREVGTKDLGYFNERGLCFVSRVDDTINVAGINVYPREVEEVVLELPGVEEAIVYKRSDPYAGERVCLKFVARRAVDVAEVRRFCAEQLTPYAVPLEIHQVTDIPKLENGKVNRRQLAEPAGGQRP